MKKTLLTTCNAKYIHKNLALRWLYCSAPEQQNVFLKEYTIKEDVTKIVEDILTFDVEVIGFSVYIWNIEITKQIVALLKQRKPQLHIFAGGPEVSFESNDLLDLGFDALCCGEGEIAVWEYVKMLDADTSYDVAGMITKQYPNQTYQKVDIAYLETLENPYFLAMDEADMGKRYFYFETSRGCPYGCTYCLSSVDNKVRMFSLEYIFSILEKLSTSKVKQVKLLDRTFNADVNRALKIARYMNEHCPNQIFQFEVVAQTLSEQLLSFFCDEADKKRFRFEIGVQSFHQPTLLSVGRYQNEQRLCEVLTRMAKADLTMHADLIAALPYETLGLFQKSFNRLFELQASEIQLGILKLLKGTKLKSQHQEFGMKYHQAPPYDVIATNWLSEQDLIDLSNCASAVEKFYNDGVCRDIIMTILDEQLISDPFTLFMELGKQYALLKRPYQPYELFTCFYSVLEHVERQKVDAMLLTSYYQRFKQKPKRFTPAYVDGETRKQILHHAVDLQIADEKALFGYGVVSIAYVQHEICYQLVLYNQNQQLPQRYFFHQDLTLLK